MDSLAFSTTVAIAKPTTFTGSSVTTRRPTTVPSQTSSKKNDWKTVKSSAKADVFQWRSQTKEAKEAATSTGVYGVQCTEATSKSNDADTKRILSLSTQYRLRQSSPFTKYADLYATRRAAIIQCAGSHVMEQYMIKFPARASAAVNGQAEASLACSRYMPTTPGTADNLMQECVDRQYKQMKVPNGEYTTLCNDGTVKEMAEVTRISALAVAYRANQFSTSQKTAMKFNAVAKANALGFGCSYEENYFTQFPAMAGAMRYGNGSYAAGVLGTTLETGGKTMSVDEQIKGENVESYWPGFLMRPAVEKPKSSVKFWTIAPSTLKDYSYMSGAAVAWGIAAQAKKETVKSYDTWQPGWQPKSVLSGRK